MDLDCFFTQRRTLLASPAASKAMLCQLDRELIRAQPPAEEDRPFEEALLLAQAADPAQGTALKAFFAASDSERQWQLAALLPWLPLPQAEAADTWLMARAQLLAPARAIALPAPWDGWWQAWQGGATAAQLLTLYEQLAEHAQERLAPLLVRTEPAELVRFINALAARLPALELLPWLGLSGLGRFVPWLRDFAANPELAEAARQELNWLTGGRDTERHERQLWGQAATPELLPQLSQGLALAWQPRLWAWLQPGGSGDHWTLFGGRLCPGN
ncbi:hypothetical protein PVT67_00300 [Gallaecimonas kandeliae]|uniref:hypothetical protein n=1 Tax=Gallaecimonas kandeliae TaxID=3029055 RepID=UPI00264A12AA|nr:hypothetical protein [Gallaecimonas kandeliae]WKE65732.1 hypothetical protein PVT67_00300 [Gallaecimonas kandeliae]